MPDTAAGKVRCADCGFLSARRANDTEFYEIGQKQRETGSREVAGLSYVPYCFKDACPISKEYESHKGSGGDAKRVAFLAVINAERECPDHCDYIQGRSPKEHDDMMTAREVSDRAATEQDKSRIWQAAEAEKARKWQEEQEAKRQAWQEKQNQLKEEQDAKNRAWQEEQEAKRRQWQEEQNRLQLEKQSQLASKERWWRLVLLVVGAVIGFAASKWSDKPAEWSSPRKVDSV